MDESWSWAKPHHSLHPVLQVRPRNTCTSAMLVSVPFYWTEGMISWSELSPQSSKNKEMWIVYVLHHNILLTLSLMLFLQILLTCILALWSNTCQSGMWHWENYSSKQAYTLSTFNFCLSLKSSHCLASMNLLGIASNNYTSIFGAEKWRNSGENFICRSLVFTTEKL